MPLAVTAARRGAGCSASVRTEPLKPRHLRGRLPSLLTAMARAFSPADKQIHTHTHTHTQRWILAKWRRTFVQGPQDESAALDALEHVDDACTLPPLFLDARQPLHYYHLIYVLGLF